MATVCQALGISLETVFTAHERPPDEDRQRRQGDPGAGGVAPVTPRAAEESGRGFMDSQFPINRIAPYYVPPTDDQAAADSTGCSPTAIRETPMQRLLALAMRERMKGAESVVFEPRPIAVAVHFIYSDGRSVERDSPPKRLMGPILGAVRSLAGDSTEIFLAGKRVAVAFFDTPHGQGVSLTILGDVPLAP